MRFFIYENDLRQIAIGKALLNRGYTKVNAEEIGSADIVILPFINVETVVNIDENFFDNLKKGVKVFTGAKNDVLIEKFKKNEVSCNEILVSKEMAVLNAVPTAEGLLYNVLGDIEKCLVGANVLVLGYGICGSEIAEKVSALKANVSILEQCEVKKASAKAKGLKVVEESGIVETSLDVIVNTIPLKVVSQNTLDNINKETLIYDIASAPFGFDEETMTKKGIRYKRLRGLPSKFGIKYSSENICDFIIKSVKGVGL